MPCQLCCYVSEGRAKYLSQECHTDPVEKGAWVTLSISPLSETSAQLLLERDKTRGKKARRTEGLSSEFC